MFRISKVEVQKVFWRLYWNVKFRDYSRNSSSGSHRYHRTKWKVKKYYWCCYWNVKYRDYSRNSKSGLHRCHKTQQNLGKQFWVSKLAEYQMKTEAILFIYQCLTVRFKTFLSLFWFIFKDFFESLSGNTIWPQATDFHKIAKLTIFDIFNQLLSSQIVNEARFARNVEWDFFWSNIVQL